MKKFNKYVSIALIGTMVFAVAISTAPSFTNAETFSPLTSSTTLKVGSKSTDVTRLQQFLSSDSSIYPMGLVTGYYGALTREAVIQFQLSYSLDDDGLVGPITRAKVNNVIAVGKGIDLYAPSINNLIVAPSGRNANISFTSNELVSSALYYDTNKIVTSAWDDREMSTKVPEISGTKVIQWDFATSKQYALTNLLPNTVYNYTVVAKDQSNNSTIVWPSTFTTGN